MTQTDRILHMESILDEASVVLDALSALLDRYDAVAPAVCELEAYYTGPQRMRDYEDDRAGKLPEDMARIAGER